MIPEILHRIVLPPLTSTGSVDRNWRGFRELHPDWDLRTVSRADPDAWESGHLFEKCRSVAGVADLIRLELLWRYGGFYVDADCEPVRSLEPLRRFPCLAGTEDGFWISTGVLGAEPGHPAIRAYLDAACDEGRHDLDVPTNEVAGPVLATHVWKGRQDVTICPPDLFYAVRFGAEASTEEGRESRHSLVVHRWAHSWAEKSTPEVHRGRLMSGVQRTKPPLRAAAAKAKGKWDRLSEAPLPDIRSIYLGGGQILVRLPDGSPLTALADDRSLTPELAVNGIYDLAFWNALGSLLRPGDRSVDVGANVGLFSVRMAKLVGPLGRVDCFEPDPEVAEVLQANLDQNWLASRATVHAGALAGESGSLTFRRHPSMRMLSGKPDVANNDHAERAGETFSVPKWRLDQLASAVLPTRLVKIDVEGAETEVLDGMTGLLEAGLVDFVDFEVIRADGPSWHRTASWLRRLSKEFGGRPHTLTETGDLAPVSLDHVIAMAGHFSHILFDLR